MPGTNPLTTAGLKPPRTRTGGCCGCLFFPAIITLFGGSVFWLSGFTVGLVFHALASLVWAITYAVGHAVFGWPLPELHSPRRSSKHLRE